MSRTDPDKVGGRSSYNHPVEIDEWTAIRKEQTARLKRRKQIEKRVGKKLRARLAERGTPMPPVR